MYLRHRKNNDVANEELFVNCTLVLVKVLLEYKSCTHEDACFRRSYYERLWNFTVFKYFLVENYAFETQKQFKRE